MVILLGCFQINLVQLYQLHDIIFLFLDVCYKNILFFFTLTAYSFYIFMLSCSLSFVTIWRINDILRQVENCRVCFYFVVWGWFVLKDIFNCCMIKGEKSNKWDQCYWASSQAGHFMMHLITHRALQWLSTTDLMSNQAFIFQTQIVLSA